MHLPRYTIRLRLTVLYSGVFLVMGAILLGVAYAGGSASLSRRAIVHAVSGAVVNGHVLPVPGAGSASGEISEATPTPGVVRAQEQLVLNVHGHDRHLLLIWSGIALAIM